MSLFVLSLAAGAADVFVSPVGNDAAAGTLESPLRTLNAAARRGSGGLVHVRGNAGPYRVHNAADALVLNGTHNGTTFSCYDPSCTISGSAALPVLSAWTRSTDSRLPAGALGEVLELDLAKALPSALGRLGAVGEAGNHAALRLGDTPLRLARWPNLDPASLLTPAWARNVVSPVPPADCMLVGHEACVVVDGETAARAARWSGAAARGELALNGFWRYFWRDDVASSISVVPFDANGSTAVLLRREDGKPMGIYGAPPNASYFYAMNVLEELDQPGEYYIDRLGGKVLLFPPAGAAADAAPELSLALGPLSSVDGATNVSLAGLSFVGARGPAATVSGGRAVAFANCSFTHLGGSALTITGGTGHSLRRSALRYLGLLGVSVAGGDRPSLRRGEHLVEDCVISDYGRWLSSYKAAVHVEGVGNTVRRNELARSWGQAVTYSGNDHAIESNHVHHVALELGLYIDTLS